MKNAPARALLAFALASLASLVVGAFGGGCSTFSEDTSATTDEGGASSEGSVPDVGVPVVPGGTVLGKSMTSFLSPSDPNAGGLATAEAIPWQLATFDSSKLTAMTTEGAGAAPTIFDGASFLELPKLNDNTVIQWVTEADPTPHAFTASIDSARQHDADGYVFDFRFARTNAPTIALSQGSSDVLAASANTVMWSDDHAVGQKFHQFLYGMGDTIMGCLIDSAAPTFSVGGVRSAAPVSIPAPKTIGLYKIRIAFTSELNCAAAMNRSDISLGTTEIGAILVR